MAILKDLIVNGVSRFIGKVFINDSHINTINGVSVTQTPKFTDTNTTYTFTQDSQDGHKIIFTPSSGSSTTLIIPDNNTVYTASSPISIDGTTINHDVSGVVAASKGDTTNQTPTWGGTFKAISGTVNTTGHLTAFAEHTVTIPNSTATTSISGLMSSTDKIKVDNSVNVVASKTQPTTQTTGDIWLIIE